MHMHARAHVCAACGKVRTEYMVQARGEYMRVNAKFARAVCDRVHGASER
jgi:hypothetical protein